MGELAASSMQVVDQIYCPICGSTSYIDSDGEYYRCTSCGRL